MVNKKRKKARLFWEKLSVFAVTFLILTIISFFIFTNISVSQKRVEMIKKIEALNEEVKELENHNRNLKASLLNADDNIYIEEEARNQGYKKPGETQVVVVSQNEEKDKIEENDNKSIWQKILNKFK